MCFLVRQTAKAVGDSTWSRRSGACVNFAAWVLVPPGCWREMLIAQCAFGGCALVLLQGAAAECLWQSLGAAAAGGRYKPPVQGRCQMFMAVCTVAG